MTIIYLAFLLLTLVCMVICDHRWKLAFFLDATRASLISIVTVGLLLVWDALGILNGVFYRGDSPVSYTHLTLPTIHGSCRSRWSPYH